ncbi:MAG: cupredoxin domain-containing protein [Chloroflexi bacterium]|nr:cupredoxin domain-containing protein [Chloroflexota bacterium]
MKIGRIAVLMLPLLALVLAACGGAASTSSTSAVTTVTVEAKDFQLTPNRIEAKVGQKIRINFNNKGTVQHDFSVMVIQAKEMKSQSIGTHDMGAKTEEPQLHVTAPGGKSGWIEFIPTKAGTYDAFCTSPGHRDAGMRAQLVVTE